MDRIRFAVSADLPRIVEIYNQAISSRQVTGDIIPFTVDQRRQWFDRHDPDQCPIYVCEKEGGHIAGFLSLSPYRDRPAMRRTAEVSYYVDYSCHHQGIGSMLMETALKDCARLGKHVLVAFILEWNEPSIKLLEKFGFEKWGYLPEVAEFSGQLCGHLLYGRKVKQ
jgi:L-amino acid N-acyltransferase YncA